MSKRRSVVLLLAGILIGILIMALFNVITGVKDGDEFSNHEVQEKMNAILHCVDDKFYFNYTDDEIYEGIYKGMVSGLGDKYSEYMTKDEYNLFMESNEGSFYGVGIVILDDSQQFNIINVEKDSPAEKAGIKTGDVLLQVDGKSYDSLETLVTNLRGEEGTKVKVTVLRGDETLDFDMTREEIVERSVTSEVLDGNIGYIKVSSFIETTDDDFRDALDEMENKEVKGLIIDLRDNGGGLLPDSLNIGDMLLDKGKLLTYIDKDGNKTAEYSNDGRTDLNYVVLVNGNTASASEVLAAAIKDNDGGKIVGEKTFGKGIVQTTRKLYDGSAIKLTEYEYRSPEGHKIHEKGVKPDVKVKNRSEDNDVQLEKAKELLN